MKHRAFTLVEMLILVTVLAVLAAIFLPAMGSHSGRRSMERRACASNLRHIGLAFRVYVADSDERFPPRGVRYDEWPSLMSGYIQEPQVFTCPSTAHEGATDYFYNARLAKIERAKIKKPGSVILSGDGNDVAWPSAYLTDLPISWRKLENSPARRHFDGANYLFIDGHVRWFKPEKITNSNPAQGAPTFEVKP